MDVDWSVELGSDDPTLEFPWAAYDGQLAYVNLKKQPERIPEISEAQATPELADFLSTINAPKSLLLTAKCDVWTTNELNEQERFYKAKIKFCSYVDLLFAAEAERRSFPKHEQFVKSFARFLSSSEAGSGLLPAVVAEFIVRRCWFHPSVVAENLSTRDGGNASAELQEGFYVTFYLFGYGAEEDEARSNWRRGLKHISRVLAQISS